MEGKSSEVVPMLQRAKAAKYVKQFCQLVAAAGLLASGAVAALQGQQIGVAAGVLPRKGELYEVSRPRLLADGWKPVPATCSSRNICFEGLRELATNLDSGKSCGLLARSTDVLRICIGGGVADALPVESATLNPGLGQGRQDSHQDVRFRPKAD